jgi:hypothetical protein
MNRMRPHQPGSRAFWATALSALICALTLALPLTADAAPLAAGSDMPTLSLNDQHDKPAPVGQVTNIPRTAGSATVLRLEGGRVTQVVTARQAADLRALIGLPAKPATP